MANRSTLTMHDIENDKSLRVVSEAEAHQLMAQEAARDALRREERAKRAMIRFAARKAQTERHTAKQERMRPHREAVQALAPGEECEIPPSEYALVYRIGLETGRVFKTHKRLNGMLRVTRKADRNLGAAEGLL